MLRPYRDIFRHTFCCIATLNNKTNRTKSDFPSALTCHVSVTGKPTKKCQSIPVAVHKYKKMSSYTLVELYSQHFRKRVGWRFNKKAVSAFLSLFLQKNSDARKYHKFGILNAVLHFSNCRTTFKIPNFSYFLESVFFWRKEQKNAEIGFLMNLHPPHFQKYWLYNSTKV